MQSQIPLPTDNIYKFYALFGLLLFIFSAGALLYAVKTKNELSFESSIEIATLKQIPAPTLPESAKLKALEQRLAVADNDLNFYTRVTGVFMGIGTLLVIGGFWEWHTKIQRREDEWTELQLTKLRYEVSQLSAPIPSAEESSSGDPEAVS